MRRPWALLPCAACSGLLGIDRIPFVPADDAPRDGAPPATDAPADAPITGPLTLHVVLTGSGGEVKDDQGKLDCVPGGSGCSATYPSGPVMLTPTATAPIEFNLWEGACLHQNSPDVMTFPVCNLSLGGMVTVIADFQDLQNRAVLNLIPSAASSGRDGSAVVTTSFGETCPSGSACIFPYSVVPTSVGITGTGDACAPFNSFDGGGCNGATNKCTVAFGSNGNGTIVTVDYTFNTGNGSSCTQ